MLNTAKPSQRLSFAEPKGASDLPLVGVLVSTSLSVCKFSKEPKKEAVRLRRTSLLGTGIPASCSLVSKSDVEGTCLMLPSSRPAFCHKAAMMLGVSTSKAQP